MINSKQYALSSMIARNTTAAICLVKENSINLIQYIDDQRQTVIHQCVKLRNLDFLKFLSTYLITIYNEEEMQSLLNKFNTEQFTALHVASYNGDVVNTKYNLKESVKLLLLMGAQASTQSGSGLLPIHTAAQGDQIIMIKFWIDQGYQINLLDSQLNSVLHWACFQNCEITVNFLIAWGIDLNARNQQGYTALHLACIQSANKIVRKLLIRGADRLIVDNQNKTPLDMTDDQKIQKMLLDPTDCYVLCNLRQPFRVQKRSIQSILMFLTIFCSTNFYILELAFEEYFAFFVGQLFTTIFTLLTYATVCGSDPGCIDSNQVDIFQEDVAPELICPDCQIIKPRRSKHCEICKQCVIVYDHHCPWINNCIGAKNFKIFFCFIFLTIVNFVTSIVIIIIFLIYAELSVESLKLLYPSLVIGILIYPIGSLLYYQTQNLFKGLTTYERFHSQTQGMQKSVLIPDEQSVFESSTLGESVVSNDKYATLDQEMKSPIDNCLDMCFRNQYTYNQQ